MRSFLFVLALCGASSISMAQPLSQCISYNGNSCWFAEDKSQTPTSFFCQDKYKSEFKVQLNSNEKFSYQFSLGYGDGMGYPEPGVISNCTVQYGNGKVIRFQFASIDWGNKVEMTSHDDDVAVTLTTVWFSSKSETYVFH